MAVGNFCVLSRMETDLDRKRVLFGSMDMKSQFRLMPDLNQASGVALALRYDQYKDRVAAIFSPEEEGILWKSNYKSLKQNRRVTTTDYIQRKARLFRRSYKESPNSGHFLEDAIACIYDTEVRREVIRSDPKDYNSLMEAAQKAVGFVRLSQVHLNPNENGLASISHPAPAVTTTAKVETVGELRGQSWGGESESVEEEPLTIAQMEFCVFNETNKETVF